MTDLQLEIRDLKITSPATMKRVGDFLALHGLLPDPDISYMAGIHDAYDRLLGCGALGGDTIKCLALDKQMQGEGMAARLVGHLLDKAFAAGISNVRVFTKPLYAALFESLGFSIVGRSEKAVLLESDPAPLRRYCSYLASRKADGVIVINANPLTLGHMHLITHAAAACRRLAIVPVAENSHNDFSYEERVTVLNDATSHISSAEVLEGSAYAISPATFPSYFIKLRNEVSEVQARLDLDIFGRRIARSLGAIRRFVGTEPSDPLTAQYNRIMQECLPEYGIEVVELPRLEQDNQPISASRVRGLLASGHFRKALDLVPPADTPALLAYTACRALRMELDLEPKPGLVDPHDNGSHADMDHALMTRSIAALRPWFFSLAHAAYSGETLDGRRLREAGIEGERMMLEATSGVNTHKGAVFAMGLAVAAAARIMGHHSDATIQEEIASLAASIAGIPLLQEEKSHGDTIRERYGIPGALDNALVGYPLLFDSWLPFLQSRPDSRDTRLMLLMKIISEMPDTNAYYRAGAEEAVKAMHKASLILHDFSEDALRRLNEEFRLVNISHGGAADMLGLTFFIDSITRM